jgi:hypothetical protein
MGTILVPLFAHRRPAAPPVQAAYAEGLHSHRTSAVFKAQQPGRRTHSKARTSSWRYMLGPPTGGLCQQVLQLLLPELCIIGGEVPAGVFARRDQEQPSIL